MSWLLPIRPQWQGALAGALALALLLIGTVAVFPPARALAEEVLSALMGRVEQTKVITIENGVATEEKVVTVEHAEPQTLAEAQARVGFQIRLPAYLPEGYTDIKFVTSLPGLVIVQFHTPPSSKEGIKSFELYEIKGDPGRFLGGEPVREVLVNGNVAIWAEGRATREAGNPSPLVYHVLYWQEDGISFALHSYTLPLEEMLKIAESLR